MITALTWILKRQEARLASDGIKFMEKRILGCETPQIVAKTLEELWGKRPIWARDSEYLWSEISRFKTVKRGWGGQIIEMLEKWIVTMDNKVGNLNDKLLISKLQTVK